MIPPYLVPWNLEEHFSQQKIPPILDYFNVSTACIRLESDMDEELSVRVVSVCVHGSEVCQHRPSHHVLLLVKTKHWSVVHLHSCHQCQSKSFLSKFNINVENESFAKKNMY